MLTDSARATLIESVFVARLIESKLYGEPKEGLVAELAEKAPAGLTHEGLLSAANAIIRKRNNGAFPALPACLSEIEARTSLADQRFQTGGQSITKDTYAERAIQFCRRAGFKPKVVKRESDTESQWLTWQAYFKAIEMRGLAGHMRSAQIMTFPIDWPWEFDNFSPVGSAVQPERVQYYSPDRTPLIRAYQEAAE